jgi:hypothetical protein
MLHIDEVYNVLSLQQWLAACKKRGVEAVPATPIGSCWAGEIMAAGWEMPDAPIANLRHLAGLVGTIDWGTDVMRWDCCAGDSVKRDMARFGACDGSRRHEFSLDDMRLLSIVESWPAMAPISLLRRPWVEATRHDGWPVEFRVFVENSKVVGVSNYYPQVSLPDAYAVWAEDAMVRTVPLLDAASNFTADWLLTADSMLLYLEGGPPHTLAGGAHPCCFDTGETRGVALSPRTTAGEDR